MGDTPSQRVKADVKIIFWRDEHFATQTRRSIIRRHGVSLAALCKLRISRGVMTILELPTYHGATENGTKASSINELTSLPGDTHGTDIADKSQRRLSGPQIQMIAIAGTIGTGLFLALGQVLAVTGPLGILLAYFHVSSVVHFRTMVGWAYYYVQITAACALIGFWDPNESRKYLYITLLCVLTVVVNMIGTRFFGQCMLHFSSSRLKINFPS
ncbi:hypothetical protein B0H12DRAFT_1076196 [Mycena haematopus]|nr:hypothetical protein B0H12DRAFT_1076196 [Mycena haematopus]